MQSLKHEQTLEQFFEPLYIPNYYTIWHSEGQWWWLHQLIKWNLQYKRLEFTMVWIHLVYMQSILLLYQRLEFTMVWIHLVHIPSILFISPTTDWSLPWCRFTRFTYCLFNLLFIARDITTKSTLWGEVYMYYLNVWRTKMKVCNLTAVTGNSEMSRGKGQKRKLEGKGKDRITGTQRNWITGTF